MDVEIKTELERKLIDSLASCLHQAIGYHDDNNDHDYLDAFGSCLSAYEEAIGVLEDCGVLDPPRKRGTHGVVQRIRWAVIDGH